MVCSRCDLFQTGVTSTPCAAASTNARNCAFAWRAKRSPTPKEYLSNFKALPISSPLLFILSILPTLVESSSHIKDGPRTCPAPTDFISRPRSFRGGLLQELRESEPLLTDAFDGEARHRLRAEGREVCVVLNALRVVRVLARLELEEELARLFGPITFENLLAFAVHVNQRDSLFGGDGAHDVRVLAVRVLKNSLPVEAAAHDGRQKDGRRLPLAHVFDESHEVPSVVFGRRVAVCLLLRLVVVAELYEDVIAGPESVNDRLPAVF